MYRKKVWKLAGCLVLCCCLHSQPLFAAGTGPGEERKAQELRTDEEEVVIERFRRILQGVLAADIAVSVIYIRNERKKTETNRGMLFIEKIEEENDVSKKEKL